MDDLRDYAELAVVITAFVIPTLVFILAGITTALFGEDVPESIEGEETRGLD